MSENLLSLRGIHKRYGATHALRGIDLDLHGGEVLALVGENGAGKSTLVKLLTGVVPFDEGSITVKGQAHRFLNAHASQATGILAVHQETVMFEELSVAENIFVGRHLQRGPLIDWSGINQQAQQVLEEMGATFRATTLVKDLSLAQRHLVEIARALSQKASVLILDEPTAALSQQEIRDFYGMVRRLRSQGVGIIFITHKFDEIFAVADRYLVLRDGATVGTGRMADVSEQELVKLMAGRAIDQIYPVIQTVPSEVVMSVRGYSHPTEFQDMSFDLRRGEILGFYGLVGSGRSELMLAIMGLSRTARGDLTVNGQPLQPKRPADSIRAGIAYVPEERQSQGGILGLSVLQNMTLAGLTQFARGPWLSRLKEHKLFEAMVQRLQVKTDSPDTHLSGLSGGNQQKVVIAKWLGLNPRIVILDEPTKGIDVGAKQAVYQLIADMVNDGLAVILVSSELPEVMNLAHRVIVMHRGRQVAEYAQGQVGAETIVSAASGIHGADQKVSMPTVAMEAA